MSNSSTNTHTKVFDPREASKYLEELQKNHKLLSTIRYNHEFDWSKHQGLEREDVKLVVDRCPVTELKQLYEKALETLSNNDQSTLLACDDISNDMPQSNKLRTSYVLYAERQNDKYNIIAASAIQKKEFDWEKIATMGFTTFLGSIGLGALAGSIVGPVGTVVVGLAAAAGSVGIANKAYHDYHQQMPQAVYAYIFQELKAKRLLQITGSKVSFEHIQN
ncbi:unnamed protein product [Adineta ricciae]|uniref:Uncharacterized protein n=1 Tax=Adineta ricciae TaxID=249248 RepID=A0A816AYG3_ADIRI|nr:unnamed protein product [Adineta ricciae]CAF1600831.1 unnamed protein product [Adineta ricciae]